MDRKEIIYRNVQVIFSILLTLLMCLAILIPAFSEDLTQTFISRDKERESFKTDLYVSSIYTEIVCTIGLFAHFKKSYRLIRIFNLFKGINCIFSLYISIRVFALSLLTVLNLILLYVGCKYERYLKEELHQTNHNRNQNRNQIEIQTISGNSLQTNRSRYADPSPAYEPPPPYTEQLTQIPKIEMSSSDFPVLVDT